MKKYLKYLCLIFAAILILSSCSYNYAGYANGIQVINNSSKQIKNIAKGSEVGMYADNSFIKNGDSLFFDCPSIRNYSFSITVTDKNDAKYVSQVFIKDFSTDVLYYIYIIDAPNEGIAFSDKSEGR